LVYGRESRGDRSVIRPVPITEPMTDRIKWHICSTKKLSNGEEYFSDCSERVQKDIEDFRRRFPNAQLPPILLEKKNEVQTIVKTATEMHKEKTEHGDRAPKRYALCSQRVLLPTFEG
jgi:hypothetical protein